MRIKKASGELQEFSREKLARSLENAGVDPVAADEVVDHIAGQVYEGMTTKVIHDRAFAMLKAKGKAQAARYSLKKALAALGPSGFPFERYVARIFNALGYQTSVNVIIRGRCIAHEVDVVLAKGEASGLGECKFHALPGARCDVKVPLYVHARFLDIAAHDAKYENGEGWLVTNTKFTDDAQAYGSCVGLKLLGWNAGPLGESLERLIGVRKLHPITCLTTLAQNKKQELLASGIVLCQDILKQPELVSPRVLAEAEALCGHFE